MPARSLVSLAVTPRVTQALVIVIVAIFLITQVDQSAMFVRFGLRPIDVGAGEWWRLISSAFLHAGLFHIAFNGILLWRLGEMLETAVGHARFLALFALGLAGGSLGVMGLSWLTVATRLAEVPVIGPIIATSPAGITVGASGAVFGLMGAAVVGMRDRGINPWRTDIGMLVLLNLVITVVFSSAISVGGHVGGLLAGMLGGRLVLVSRDRARRATVVTWIVAVVTLAAAIALGVAGNTALLRLLGR